ncbi:hypothetical protein BDZ94DRAFT_1270843 [Collybia nuda]|uniref:DUF7330 domain-containing protein n=1 Tax=Collybia nuda TaxID=64659 RepID=A0A9P5XX97_9AGAR|nr:hypothetical protein BDZ94DRAFT_1270843 [Collybia nuda]
MIIVPSDEVESAKRAEAQAAPKVVNVQSDDPPPSYSPLSQTVAQPPPPPFPVQPGIKPSNFVSISRNNGSVKDRWFLDPGLMIPTSQLLPLPAGETEDRRKNLNIESRNGEIVADVTLAQYNPNREINALDRKRAIIHVKSYNGGITTKVHTPHSPRLPFYLDVLAYNGAVHIYLPRTFHGLLAIKTWNGSTKFSAEASTEITTFSDIDKVHRCFIGDFSEWQDQESWTGDEVTIEAKHGSVKVLYDDEVHDTTKSKGFFGRFFGL